MASQVSHIIYAKRYFDQIESGAVENTFGKLKKDEFLLGCVFPDIRLIDENVKRKETHLKYPVLDLDFSGLTSFEAGWKFHLYCDMRREEILNKYNFYSFEKSADLSGRPAKFLEDEVIYGKYNNWEKLVHYFNNPPIIDTGLDISKETLHLWYAILAKYIEAKPDIKSIRIFLSKIRLTHKEEIIGALSEIEKDRKIIEILEKVCREVV